MTETVGVGRYNGVVREELAWAAGIFDGEGYIACKAYPLASNPQRANPRMVMSVGQYHDDEVVQRFCRAVGVGKITTTAKADGKTEYVWRVQSFEKVQAVTAMLWPWLSGPKRAQASQALLSRRGLREVLGVREWRRRTYG